MTTSSITRDCRMRELVESLDAAATALELCGYRDARDDALTLPLRSYFELKHAIEEAADYLAEARFLGGQP
jgi:hypothetical protein